jgi:hypothetical protein
MLPQATFHTALGNLPLKRFLPSLHGTFLLALAMAVRLHLKATKALQLLVAILIYEVFEFVLRNACCVNYD